MSADSVATVVKMLERLPESAQERVVERLREYVSELEDERQWDETFQRTQDALVASARRAKQEIAEGKAVPMDLEKL